jgi:hypothetical protein
MQKLDNMNVPKCFCTGQGIFLRREKPTSESWTLVKMPYFRLSLFNFHFNDLEDIISDQLFINTYMNILMAIPMIKQFSLVLLVTC